MCATCEAEKFLGGFAEGATPVPIPNTEVKPLRADGTARAAVWESRSPPGLIIAKSPTSQLRGGAFCSVEMSLFFFHISMAFPLRITT